MSWTNPTAVVTLARAKVAACPSWPGGANTNLHYPYAAAGEPLPLGVFSPDQAEAQIRRQRFESGVTAIPSGMIRLTIVAPPGMTVGELETLAETLCKELTEQATGLIIGNPSHGTAGEPSDGLVAAGEGSLAIDILIPYGIGA